MLCFSSNSHLTESCKNHTKMKIIAFLPVAIMSPKCVILEQSQKSAEFGCITVSQLNSVA